MFWRAAAHFVTRCFQARAHVGGLRGLLDPAIELSGDGRTQAAWAKVADPGVGHGGTAKTGFFQGGYLRRSFGAGGLDHRQCAQLAALHVLHDGAQHQDAHLHLSAQQVGQGWAAAFVGHVDQLRAGDFFQHQAREVLRGVGPSGHIAHFAGVGLGVGHELFHRLHRQRRVDHDGDGCTRRFQDGGEVALVVKGHAFEHMGLQNLR